jgi:hypothetical protein
VGQALQMALYGLIGASLLSYPAVSSVVADVPSDARLDPSVLLLVLTVGVADWQVRSYRRLTRRARALPGGPAGVGSVARRLLLRSFARYGAVLGTASVLLWASLWIRDGAVAPETILLSASHGVVGAALLLNLVLIAHSRADIALRSFNVAGSAFVALLVVHTAEPLAPAVLSALVLVLCAGLLGFLLLAASRVVR